VRSMLRPRRPHRPRTPLIVHEAPDQHAATAQLRDARRRRRLAVVPAAGTPPTKGGRAPAIVEALVQRWGVHNHQGGKRVWARLAAPVTAAADPAAADHRRAAKGGADQRMAPQRRRMFPLCYGRTSSPVGVRPGSVSGRPLDVTGDAVSCGCAVGARAG
jgi:hypothetical protein